MAATSHPLATRAALGMLDAGGNACDAAVAAAAVLCVCEPMSTGVGGDAFALVWRDGALTGLNASGRAPAAADPELLDRVPLHGPMSVTVPGAVAGWVALLERHGRLGLDRCLAPAIDAAERGFAATPVIAAAWAALAPYLAADPELARCYTPAPRVGEIVRNPALAATLRRIADDGADAIARGPIAQAICAASWLDEDDLAAQRARVGRAAAPALPRRRGLRAAAERSGRRGAAGHRHRRRVRPRRRVAMPIACTYWPRP